MGFDFDKLNDLQQRRQKDNEKARNNAALDLLEGLEGLNLRDPAVQARVAAAVKALSGDVNGLAAMLGISASSEEPTQQPDSPRAIAAYSNRDNAAQGFGPEVMIRSGGKVYLPEIDPATSGAVPGSHLPLDRVEHNGFGLYQDGGLVHGYVRNPVPAHMPTQRIPTHDQDDDPELPVRNRHGREIRRIRRSAGIPDRTLSNESDSTGRITHFVEQPYFKFGR